MVIRVKYDDEEEEEMPWPDPEASLLEEDVKVIYNTNPHPLTTNSNLNLTVKVQREAEIGWPPRQGWVEASLLKSAMKIEGGMQGTDAANLTQALLKFALEWEKRCDAALIQVEATRKVQLGSGLGLGLGHSSRGN